MRSDFLLDPDVIFLNHGSFGACPKPVFEQYQAWQLELERQPVEFLGRRYDGLMTTAAESLAHYLGTSAENLVFVPNATVGLNTIARAIDLQPGDEVLTTTHDYGALEMTWRHVAYVTGATIVERAIPLPLQDEDAITEALFTGLSERTKVIFLSHITSPTALILPVRKIAQLARDLGILTVIDGAHVPGQLELNLDELGVDFYSGNLHKWLCAPKGSAFYYARPEHHDLIQPLVVSWGWAEESLVDRTRWQGTRDIASYLTVPDAIRYQQEHDWAQVRRECHELAIYAMHRLCEVTGLPPIAMPRFFAQMIVAPLPGGLDYEALKSRLYDEYRIEVPITKQGISRHFIRVSIQAYNTRADVDALVTALGEILRDE